MNQAVHNHLTDESQTRQLDTPPDLMVVDGLVVYPANALDSRLSGDYVPFGSSPTKSLKSREQYIRIQKRKKMARKRGLSQLISRGKEMMTDA